MESSGKRSSPTDRGSPDDEGITNSPTKGRQRTQISSEATSLTESFSTATVAGPKGDGGGEEKDERLCGFLRIVAGGNDEVMSQLFSMFPTHEDLVTHAGVYFDSEDVRAQVKESLSIPYITRLIAVLKYVSSGRAWSDGLSLSGINDTVFGVGQPSRITTASEPSSKDTVPKDTVPSDLSTKDVVGLELLADGVSFSLDKFFEEAARIEGSDGSEWVLVDSPILTENKVAVDAENQNYVDRDSIKDELEHKLQARLMWFGSQPLPKTIQNNGSTRIRLSLKLRCYAYNKECNCKFEVKVETYSDEPDTSKVYVKRIHTCNSDIDYSTKQGGMTLSQKEYVDLLLDTGMAPSQIEAQIVGLERKNKEFCRKLHLYGNSGVLPTLKQIQTRADSCNRKSDSSAGSRTTIARMQELVEEAISVPDSDEEPFVLHYHFTSVNNFCIVISSRKLLAKLGLTNRRAMDGTYKLLKSGFPVLIIGVDDADGHFHPVVIALSATEQGGDFKFASDAIEKHEPTTHDTLHLISDAAEAIRNGLKESMEQVECPQNATCACATTTTCSTSTSTSTDNTNSVTGRESSSTCRATSTSSILGVDHPSNGTASIEAPCGSAATECGEGYQEGRDIIAPECVDVVMNMCYFHMKKACRSMALGQTKTKSGEATGKLINTSYWDGHNGDSLRDDIEALHNIPHPFTAIFDAVLVLFYEKWTGLGEGSFVAYHKKEWGRDARRWAICHHPLGYSSSNNGLESNNRWIKLVARHRRQYVVQFFEFMMTQVKLWGRNSKALVTPSTRPPLKQEDWQNYEKYLRDRGEYGVLEVESECGEVFVPSMSSFARWKKTALSDDNNLLPDDAIKDIMTKQRDEALSKFRTLWASMKTGDITDVVDSFDEFVSISQSFYVVAPLPASEARSDMHHSCTCPAYSRRHGSCKHSMYEGVKRKLFTKPQQFQNLERGKAKRGRPKKTAPALQKQPSDIQT